MVAQILLFVFLFLVFHTYLFYPVIVRILAIKKKQNTNIFSYEQLPEVTIIMAAHNEEHVIAKKIQSIADSDYPVEKIIILIGTDNCSDNTEAIIQKFIETNSSISLISFKERTGKVEIMNQLVGKSKSEILVLTDANVFFNKDTLHQLIKHFANEEIGLVGANIINTNIKPSGISFQEKTYLMSENKIKYYEGIAWGAMIGAFGGCYAMRKELYKPVPKNYIVDDFYLTMSVLASKKNAINELQATCEEDVSNILKEEFRRKVRISIGNFQNLKSFIFLLKKPFSRLSLAFFSHKILRWLTPFFLIAIYLISLYLSFYFSIYKTFFVVQSILMFIPILDALLRKINLHVILLRFVTHFYSMNLALLVGFFKYISGVNINVWKPTKRYQ